MKQNQCRGCLNEEIKKKYPQLTVEELRLIPYLQYCLLNHERISNISVSEISILAEWETKGYIQINANNTLKCSREFWGMMNDVLFIAYCPEIE